MNSIEVAVYNFCKSLVDAAETGTPLYDAVIHSDVYEVMPDKTGTKYIRIDNVDFAKPQRATNHNGESFIKDFNALIDIQFIKTASSQDAAILRDARNTASDMAAAFINAAIPEEGDATLGTGDGSICGAEVEKKNVYTPAGSNAKAPATILTLKLNPLSN